MTEDTRLEPDTLPLYFAYGAHLDPGQMELACPGHRVLCRARLLDHELAFHGRSRLWGGAIAAPDPRAGSIVHGVVYQLKPADFAKLDVSEGYAGPGDPANRSERVRIEVELENGESFEVYTYVLAAPEPYGIPTRAYRWAIVSGMRHHGLPAEAIAAVESVGVLD